MNHRLHIPDALIEWGKREEQVRRWYQPWAHELERIIRAHEEPCPGCDATPALEHRDVPCDVCEGTGQRSIPITGEPLLRFWARLEALVAEAVYAGRPDLLVELDMFSAYQLRLRYRFEDGSRSLSVGERGSWDFPTAERLLEAVREPESAMAIEAARGLVEKAFPGSQIDAIIGPEELGSDACAACGETDAVVMFEISSAAPNPASAYCASCWRFLTASWPRVVQRGNRVKVEWPEDRA